MLCCVTLEAVPGYSQLVNVLGNCVKFPEILRHYQCYVLNFMLMSTPAHCHTILVFIYVMLTWVDYGLYSG